MFRQDEFDIDNDGKEKRTRSDDDHPFDHNSKRIRHEPYAEIKTSRYLTIIDVRSS
jgi:hypothetical protein